MKRFVSAMLFCLLLAGCKTNTLYSDAHQNLALLPFDEVGDMDLEPTNHQALWGGVIARTVNMTDRTQIEVVFFPLDDQGKPRSDGESLGRFRVYVGDFVDPFVYRPGRKLTVLGTLGIRERGYVGGYPYDYTVLHSLEVHLWRDNQPFVVPELIQQYLAPPDLYGYQ